MRKYFLILTALLVVSAFIACGGGGEEKAEKMKETKMTEDSGKMATGGYQAMAVTDGGTIMGTVSYTGAIPQKTKIDITKDVAVCGQGTHYKEDLIVSQNKGLKNVVVRLTGVMKGKDFEGGTYELDQHNCRFQPHITVVPVGQELTILNSDGILHNIHTYSEKNEPMNVAQPGFRKKMVQSFSKQEVVRVACDVHNWMVGYIVVAGQPYVAVTGDEGSFSLGDVPAGSYTVEFWHETLGKKSAQVTVEAGGTAKTDMAFAPAGS